MARELDPDNLDSSSSRSAGSASDDPLRRVDRVMELVGIALLPIGLTALLLGYLGVASHGLVFLQMPYVISGGLLGIGLLFAGGLIYLASWLSRTSAVQRRQNEELIAEVRQLRASLGAGALAGTTGGSSTNGGSDGTYVATPSGSMFHRPDCAVVLDREDTHEVEDTAELRPCGMCDPLGADIAQAHSN